MVIFKLAAKPTKPPRLNPPDFGQDGEDYARAALIVFSMVKDPRKRSKVHGYRPPKRREAELDALLEHRTFGQLCEERLFVRTRKDQEAATLRAQINAELADRKDFIRDTFSPEDDRYIRIDEKLSLILSWIFDGAGRR